MKRPGIVVAIAMAFLAKDATSITKTSPGCFVASTLGTRRYHYARPLGLKPTKKA